MAEKVPESGRVRPVAFLPWVREGEGDAQAAPAEGEAIVAAPSAGVARLTAHVTEPDAAQEGARPGPADVAVDEGSAVPDLEEPDVEAVADRIVRGLSRKSLSVAEVEQRLYAEGIAERDAAEVVERFQRFGYLDDLRMAEQLVTSLRERKKLGRSAIASELRARKLDSECIASALDALDGDDEYRTALELALKRLPSLRSLSDEVAERRLTGFLARRGYPGATVQKVVRDAIRKPGSSVRFR